MKIVIVVSGGCVQSVYSSTGNTDVVLLDMDNLKADGLTSEEREAQLAEAIKTAPTMVL